MPDLFRVFPYLPGARPDEPGGALFIPPQGAGRIDNPDLFSVFYASDAAAGAVAEAFGRFPEWTPAILAGSPALPGSCRALAQCRIPDRVALCDLDDPAQLAALGLRPSHVVSRDYARTRQWARRIHAQGRWSGVRWWSFYDPRWTSAGLWNTAELSLVEIRPLRLESAEVIEAAGAIARRIVAR